MPVVKDVSKRSMVIYILQSEDRKSELASAKWMVANSNITAHMEEKEKRKSYCIFASASCYSSTWRYYFCYLANNLHLNYPNTMAMRSKAACSF